MSTSNCPSLIAPLDLSTSKHVRHASLFDIIFKDDTWVQAINGLGQGDSAVPPPVVSLLGHDLVKAPNDARTPTFLALVISDWAGDSLYHQDKLFASFREQDYEFDKESCEVTFKKHGLVLHIGDAIHGNEWINMRHPGRLFTWDEGTLRAAVSYYCDAAPRTIDSSSIGGIDDFSADSGEHVDYICSVRLEFGNGMPVYRVFIAFELPMQLVSKRAKTGDRPGWITS